MKRILFLLLPLFIFACQAESTGPEKGFKVFHTADIIHFWEAYDAIRATEDTLQQLQILQDHYVGKASEGLKAFMKSRQVTSHTFLELINTLPDFWASVRPHTLSGVARTDEIEVAIDRFRALYPKLKPAEIYLFIGGLKSGGTVLDGRSLIAAEISCANSAVNITEFEESQHEWLIPVMSNATSDHFVQMNVHEYVHTQQKDYLQNVLCKSISEGMADFIAELVLEEPITAVYITYGYQHFNEVKAEFRQDLFTDNISDWMYGENSRGRVRDLGYFMGYVICKGYYEQAKNKQEAVAEIIELELTDLEKAIRFLNTSGVYEEEITAPKSVVYPDTTAKVTFEVVVPHASDSVYITGSHESLGAWDPGKVQLKPISGRKRSIQLFLNAPVEFKLTRGSWETEGLLSGERSGSNMKLGFFQDTTVRVTIEAWKDRMK
jgi:hypothetical protein